MYCSNSLQLDAISIINSLFTYSLLYVKEITHSALSQSNFYFKVLSLFDAHRSVTSTPLWDALSDACANYSAELTEVDADKVLTNDTTLIRPGIKLQSFVLNKTMP